MVQARRNDSINMEAPGMQNIRGKVTNVPAVVLRLLAQFT